MSHGDPARIEREFGLALDTVDLAALQRARRRGAGPEELLEAVLVHETWFFRDPAVFDRIAALARTKRGPLRVLSAPCSTGEEAYSCAITLRRAGLDLASCTIIGADVSAPSLAAARAGRYGAPSFRSPDAEWDEAWFGAPDEAGRRTIATELREAVRFVPSNLVQDAPGIHGPFDVILCRNFTVYLTGGARRRLGATLTRLLHPDGMLFLGPTEELPGFVRVPPTAACAFRPAAAPLAAVTAPPVSAQPSLAGRSPR